MPSIEVEHIFEGQMEKVFNGIAQYSDYIEYIQGVTGIEVLDPVEPGSVCQVRYELNIIKKFFYILNMFENKPKEISWTLAESNVMKKNEGRWLLTDNGDGTTTADYGFEVVFKGLVPSALTNKVAKTSLPALFEGMQKLINDHG